MSVIIHLDSSYIGFIFLLITEIFLVTIVTSAQIRIIDTEMKRRLDNGETVDLILKEYGPFKINTSLGMSRVLFLIFPAIIVLMMVALSELGISGRSIPTYSNQDVIISGKYFALDSIYTGDKIISQYDSVENRIVSEFIFYSEAPLEFSGVWNQCVEFVDNSAIIGRVATTKYTNDLINEEYGETFCSEENDVIVYQKSLTSCRFDETQTISYIYYFVNPEKELIYTANRDLDIYTGDSYITHNIYHGTADIFTEECEENISGKRDIFWVGFESTDTYFAILDYGDETVERWIIDPAITIFSELSGSNVNSERKRIGTANAGVDFETVIIECKEGCFEAIVQWCFSIGPIDNIFETAERFTIRDVDKFLSIWYGGLNYGGRFTEVGLLTSSTQFPSYESGRPYGVGVTSGSDLDEYSGPPPTCDRNPDDSISGWISGFDPSFKTVSCIDAVSQLYLPDDGEENVTEVTIWAISILCIALFISLVYYFYTKNSGYDLFSYNGLLKAWFKDVNTECEWVKNPMSISIVNGKVSASVVS